MMLFEFTTARGVESWHALDDPVMGGRSHSALHWLEPGYACFHGVVSLENGGGFASVRYNKTAFNLSAYTGTELRVKGDSKHYQLRFGTHAPQVAYAQHFYAGQDWSTIRLPFSGFTATFRGQDVRGAPVLDLSRLLEVTLMLADKQAGTFELYLDWIRAYR